jgi:hypothetical protein
MLRTMFAWFQAGIVPKVFADTLQVIGQDNGVIAARARGCTDNPDWPE